MTPPRKPPRQFSTHETPARDIEAEEGFTERRRFNERRKDEPKTLVEWLNQIVSVKNGIISALSFASAMGISIQMQSPKVLKLERDNLALTLRIDSLEKRVSNTQDVLNDGVRLRCLQDSIDMMLQNTLQCRERYGLVNGKYLLVPSNPLR